MLNRLGSYLFTPPASAPYAQATIDAAGNTVFDYKESRWSCLAEDWCGNRHKFHHYLSLVAGSGLGLVQFAHGIGLKRFLTQHPAVQRWLDLKETQHLGRRPFNKKDYALVQGITQQIFHRYAALHGLKVTCRGQENIPQHGQVIYAFVPHASLTPDFLYILFDPRVAFVGDRNNFYLDAKTQTIGFDQYADAWGMPLADRKNSKENPPLLQYTTERMLDVGLRPGFFLHAGRVHPAWTDTGALGRAGYYLSASGQDPLEFLHTGGVRCLAERVMQVSADDVWVVPVSIRGAEQVMPATSSDWPFVAAAGINLDLAFQVHPAQLCPRSNSAKGKLNPASFDHFIGELLAPAVDALEINPFLQSALVAWNEEHRLIPHSCIEDVWQERVLGDSLQLYLCALDGIRSIHPRFNGSRQQPSRRQAIHATLRMLQASLTQLGAGEQLGLVEDILQAATASREMTRTWPDHV